MVIVLHLLLVIAITLSGLPGGAAPAPVQAVSGPCLAVCAYVQVISGTLTTNSVYDGDGNRVKQTNISGTTLYVGPHYEVFVPVPTSTPTPQPTPTPRPGLTYRVYFPVVMNCYYAIEGQQAQTTKYYFANGNRIAMRQGCSDQVTYFYQDHLGSTVAISSSGESTRYWPYGSTRSGSVSTAYRFTGQRLDEGTGLYYYGARYYDPALGRFISADTVVPSPGNPKALNRYSYVYNNPLRFVDPTGMFTEEELLGWGITQEQINAWRNSDPAWWAIVAAAQLYDMVTAMNPYTSGEPRPVQGNFSLLPESWKPQQRLTISGRQLESFRKGTQNQELWRQEVSGWKHIPTPQYFYDKSPQAVIRPRSPGIYFDPDKVDWTSVGRNAVSILSAGVAKKAEGVSEGIHRIAVGTGMASSAYSTAQDYLSGAEGWKLALDAGGLHPDVRVSVVASILSLATDLHSGYEVVWR